MALDIRLLFHEPRIAGNTGATIRLAAVTGAELHLSGRLGFDLEDAKLRRAGLDYHDLAYLRVHETLEDAFALLLPARIFAFTSRGSLRHTDVDYRATDVLLFGSEPDGLPPEVLADPRITAQVRIPMLPGRRSLNLASSAGIVAYEAWRQHGFSGAG
ncbi:MAG: tRNA (cytidine(34)-2'-O)-methyltransferase [Propioniciclava sp.]